MESGVVSASRGGDSNPDPYIRIPSDLFGERHGRHAPFIRLSMGHFRQRAAGVYPPPRPLPKPQPWTLQTSGHAALDNRHSHYRHQHSHHQYHHQHQHQPHSRHHHQHQHQQRGSRHGGEPGQRWTEQNRLLTSLDSNLPPSPAASDYRRSQDRPRRSNSYRLHHHGHYLPPEYRRRVDESRRSRFHPSDLWHQGHSLPRLSPSLAVPLVRGRNRTRAHMLADELLDEETAMGGGDTDDLDGLIDLVARANDLHVEPGSILPGLKTNACSFHNRHLPSDRRALDLLYATSCHGGKVPPFKLPVDLHHHGNPRRGHHFNDPNPDVCLTSRSDYIPRGGGVMDAEVRDALLGKGRKVKDVVHGGGKVNGADRAGGPAGVVFNPSGLGGQHVLLQQQQQQQQQQHQQEQQQQQRRFPSKLPEKLAREDMVMSWLQHGSVPEGGCHFPDLIPHTQDHGDHAHRHSRGRRRGDRKHSSKSE